MKNKLETRTYKHIQVKIVRPWIVDYRKIIPTVFEIQTSIYKFMWRKKLIPLPSLISFKMISFSFNYCNTFVKTRQFQQNKGYRFWFHICL